MTVAPAASEAARPARRLVVWLPWVAIVVVAAVALGIGLHRSGPRPTIEEQTLSLASQVRCPVCVGETAAQSQTAPSIEIRSIIRQDLLAGESHAQILTQLQQDYRGTAILEDPGHHGSDLILWLAPIAAVIVAVGGLALGFRRWRPAAARTSSESDRRLVGGALRKDGLDG